MRRLALASVLCLLGCHGEPSANKPSAVHVRCVAPQTEPVDEVIELPGRIEPPPGGDLPIASQVAGRLVKVSVKEGQHLVTGDIVGTVDDLASRDAVRQAEAALAQARATEANSRSTLERVKALVARGIAARQELDDAEAHAENERQAVVSSTATMNLTQRTLGRVQVRATFPGIVTHLWRGPGALVDGTSATPIVQVAANAQVEFVAAATERELGPIEPGQQARIHLDAATDELPARVRTRSSALDPATGLGTIRMTLASSPASLVMGSYGRATIALAHRDAALVLPLEALRGAVSDGAEVVLCKGGTAELHAIRVGYRDTKRLEIIEGVSVNDRVALDHVLGLDTGMAIVEGD